MTLPVACENRPLALRTTTASGQWLLGAVLLFGSQLALSSDYGELTALFAQWRAFEQPPTYQGAPDYRAQTFVSRQKKFEQLREAHRGMDISGWPLEQKVDWHIVLAEMNGYDFNQRILKPWARDPAFYKSVWTYKSDVPAHEGPTHHAVTELWTYDFPLSEKEAQRLTGDLSIIGPLYDQARENLTGNARDLWIAGIAVIRRQFQDLQALQASLAAPEPALQKALDNALTATKDLVAWLEAEARTKTGPSGIGKENYTWYLQQVHLVPLTWEEEVQLMKRELDRAWAALKLEEHRNRGLPKLTAVTTASEYDAIANAAVDDLLEFLDQQEIVTVKPYFEPALRKQMGTFLPESKRNFFTIGSHFDPRPLFSHFYHWFELARMDHEPHPSPIRRGALLYNIFDSRSEGMATAVEELFMHAGLYDDSPRSREIVWIMVAQRAARGLGSLYAHANEMPMEEAGTIHSQWTPRGWMKTEPELLLFEQHLYLRQPGYGTSYITGKYLLERTMADRAKQLEDAGKPFELRDFMDQLNAIGNIPMALGRWEMTGLDDEIRAIMAR